MLDKFWIRFPTSISSVNQFDDGAFSSEAQVLALI